jgi:hypothetical protein
MQNLPTEQHGKPKLCEIREATDWEKENIKELNFLARNFNATGHYSQTTEDQAAWCVNTLKSRMERASHDC